MVTCLAGALWKISHPVPTVARLYAAEPHLAHATATFEPTLRNDTEVIMEGAVRVADNHTAGMVEPGVVRVERRKARARRGSREPRQGTASRSVLPFTSLTRSTSIPRPARDSRRSLAIGFTRRVVTPQSR